MALATTQADEIQREMRQIRVELKENVQEIVSGAREIVDWQSYVKAYPWLTVGAAAFVGYLLVPNRTTVIRPDPEALRELTKSREMLEQQVKPKKSLMGMVVGMVAASAAQAAMSVASHQVQQLLHSLQQPPAQQPGGHRHDQSPR
jgi:hypothetical protein